MARGLLLVFTCFVTIFSCSIGLFGQNTYIFKNNNIKNKTFINNSYAVVSDFVLNKNNTPIAANMIDEIDTLAPQVSISGSCSDYLINFTEKRNGSINDNPKQLDQGVSQTPSIISNRNFNSQIDFFEEPDGIFKSLPIKYNYNFKLHVLDITKNAKIVFGITDCAGNVVVDSIEYSAEHFKIFPDNINFGITRFESDSLLSIIITNTSYTPILITDIKTKYDKFYSLLPNQISKPGRSLLPSDTCMFWIKFSPKLNTNGVKRFLDSLIISTECFANSYLLYGEGGEPVIYVEDWDAGTVDFPSNKCLQGGLSILNIGNMDLVINKIEFISDSGPFSISDNLIPSLPLSIKPNGKVFLDTMCFNPSSPGAFRTKVLISSNAKVFKNYSIWSGQLNHLGPVINNCNFNSKRVNTSNKAYIEITNSGSTPFTINDFLFENGLRNSDDGSFKIINIDCKLPAKIFPVAMSSGECVKIRVEIEFKPVTDSIYNDIKLFPIFDTNDIIHDSIYAMLDGTGTLPNFETNDIKFQNSAVLDTYHKDIKQIELSNPSKSADLKIKKIQWADSSNIMNEEFEIDTEFFNCDNIDLGSKKEFNVRFIPRGIGDRKAIIEVIHDAVIGDGISSDENYSPEIVSQIILLGKGIDDGFTANGVDFGDQCRCSEPIKSVFITNKSKIENLEISSLEFEPKYSNIFQILDDSKNIIIAPGITKEIQIKFIPKLMDENQCQAKLTINNLVNDTSIIVQASCYFTNIELSMPKLENMKAGMITNSDNQEFPIKIKKMSHNWTDAEIIGFSFEIAYNPVCWKFLDIKKGNALSDDWIITQTEVDKTSENEFKLKISAKGDAPISNDGELLKPEFWIMLSDSSIFHPKFENVSFLERDNCIKYQCINGEIIQSSCLLDLRNVMINDLKYELILPSPHPVTEDSFILKYSVGLNNSHTLIEIINSIGEIVKVLVDNIENTGDYSVKVNANQLSPGAYTIRMMSGPFKDAKSIIIVK